MVSVEVREVETCVRTFYHTILLANKNLTFVL